MYPEPSIINTANTLWKALLCVKCIRGGTIARDALPKSEEFLVVKWLNVCTGMNALELFLSSAVTIEFGQWVFEWVGKFYIFEEINKRALIYVFFNL